jgi:hypothetical protein
VCVRAYRARGVSAAGFVPRRGDLATLRDIAARIGRAAARLPRLGR